MAMVALPKEDGIHYTKENVPPFLLVFVTPATSRDCLICPPPKPSINPLI